MTRTHHGKRPWTFYALAAFFTLFVLFLYGPMFVIFVLSLQGPEGGLTFPMRGLSFHWFGKLWEGMGVVDIAAAFRRSVALGAVPAHGYAGMSSECASMARDTVREVPLRNVRPTTTARDPAGTNSTRPASRPLLW